MVVATKSEFGSRFHKGKVLAPLTSIASNGAYLVSLQMHFSMKVCDLRVQQYATT